VREVDIDQVVLVDAGQDVQRVQRRDRVADRALHARGQKRQHRRLHARVACELVDAELLLPCGLAEGVRGRRHGKLVSHSVDEPIGVLFRQLG
jgi:hypothetical protein